jgi:GH15 family glucan-1,4-alpha-glucosidase
MLLAMLETGHRDEAAVWEGWLLRAVAGDRADVQIMYGLAGERRLDEREVGWLPGYEGSRPVPVGNAASTQLQLDVYGEVVEALYQSRVHGVPADDDVWSLTRMLLGWLEHGWRLEDAGLWEVRGAARHFTHSKVMARVAFDRAVRFHEEFGAREPLTRWRRTRDEIRADILAHAWNDRRSKMSSRSMGSSSATAQRTATTGCRAAKASSWPARSGSPRCSPGRGRTGHGTGDARGGLGRPTVRATTQAPR